MIPEPDTIRRVEQYVSPDLYAHTRVQPHVITEHILRKMLADFFNSVPEDEIPLRIKISVEFIRR